MEQKKQVAGKRSSLFLPPNYKIAKLASMENHHYKVAILVPDDLLDFDENFLCYNKNGLAFYPGWWLAINLSPAAILKCPKACSWENFCQLKVIALCAVFYCCKRGTSATPTPLPQPEPRNAKDAEEGRPFIDNYHHQQPPEQQPKSSQPTAGRQILFHKSSQSTSPKRYSFNDSSRSSQNINEKKSI